MIHNNHNHNHNHNIIMDLPIKMSPDKTKFGQRHFLPQIITSRRRRLIITRRLIDDRHLMLLFVPFIDELGRLEVLVVIIIIIIWIIICHP